MYNDLLAAIIVVPFIASEMHVCFGRTRES